MRPIDELMKDSRLWDIQIMGATMFCCWVKLPDCGSCSVIWSDREMGYEHVSVSPRKKYNIPSWDDMHMLKDIFFKPEEEAYQIMPPQSEYVNVKENCLHIWRPANGKRLQDIT